MTKVIRISLYVIAGLAALLVVGVAVFALTFNPNKYKGEIERAVKEKTGRTLSLKGDLRIAFWPALGAKVAGVSLSERGSDRQFVALDSAHASVAVLPLLRGQVVVDGIRVSGLKASVVKEKDGRFNFSDLLEPSPAPKQPAKAKSEPRKAEGSKTVAFDIASFQLDRSAVAYVDRTSGQELDVGDLKLSTGRIAEKADGKLELKAHAKGKNPDLDARLDVTGGYQFDLGTNSVTVSKLEVKLAGAAAGVANLDLRVTGAVKADLGRETAEADLSTRFDESSIQAKLGLAKFSPPAYTFDVSIDKLNLDRYTKRQEKKPVATPVEGKEPAPAAQKKEEDTPIDLSFLNGLNARGRLQVGALQASGLKAANVKAEVHAANGKLDLAPHSASLYEGSVSGAITAMADGRVAVRENLSGVSIGPLLRDVAQKDMLDGKGNLALDVNAAGKSVNAMKKSLAGTARVQLKDGAIKGINLAEVFRRVKASGPQEAREAQKTDFSEMGASFTIKNGVAHNEDLDAKSPLFRVSGRGDIDVGNSTIDYFAKASLVATTQGQGGAERAQLSGFTVPVHLVGPLDAPKYQVDYAAVVKSKAAERIKSLFGR